MNTLLNPDVETFIIGGLGSDRKCMDNVVDMMSSEISNVHGVPYHEADKMGHTLWEETDSQNLILYSGSGPLAAKALERHSFRPHTVTFVSPPNVLTRWSAIVGFERAARARLDAKQSLDLQESLSETVKKFVHETGAHIPEYYKLIHNSRRFNQLASAIALKSLGIHEVSLVVPRQDEMFSSYELPTSDGSNEIAGARYIVVDGSHFRFSADPLGMLHEAEVAPYAVVTDETLGIDIPERLYTPPTISETLSIAVNGLHKVAKGLVPRAA